MSGAHGDEINAAQFPSIAARADFFEPRINSPDREVRRAALTEITYFNYHPSREFVGFLRRMCEDADPIVRGYAVRHLHQMYVDVDVQALPQPIGWHGTEGGDYSDARFRAGLLDHFRNGGTSGAIAHQIGYLGLPEAVPLLREATERADNTMTQTEIARALLDCGATESAIALWRSVIGRYREHYGREDDKSLNEYYYVQACWGLTNVEETRDEGLSALATAMSDFEDADTPNSLNKLRYAQKLFASATGTWCSTGKEAQRIIESLKTKRVEQDGADQPATDPESKPESNENPEPESEVRPQ